jgi:hypothetical protein
MITIKSGFDRDRENTDEDFKYLCAIEKIVSTRTHARRCEDLSFEPDMPKYTRSNFLKPRYLSQSAPVIGPVEDLNDSSVDIEYDSSPQLFERRNHDHSTQVDMMKERNAWDFDFNRLNVRERDTEVRDFSMEKKYHNPLTDRSINDHRPRPSPQHIRNPGRRRGRRSGGSYSLGNIGPINTHRFKNRSNNRTIIRMMRKNGTKYIDRRKRSKLIDKLIDIFREGAIKNITEMIGSNLATILSGHSKHREVHLLSLR